MSLDVWAPMLTSNLHNKNLSARNKDTHVKIVRGCEACAAICCDCDLWKPITQDTKKDFRSSGKQARLRTKKYNDFRKVVIFNSIPDALRNLHTSKYKRPRNKPNDGCLWKLVKYNSVRTSKQLRFVASTETFTGNQASVCTKITSLSCYSF